MEAFVGQRSFISAGFSAGNLSQKRLDSWSDERQHCKNDVFSRKSRSFGALGNLPYSAQGSVKHRKGADLPSVRQHASASYSRGEDSSGAQTQSSRPGRSCEGACSNCVSSDAPNGRSADLDPSTDLQGPDHRTDHLTPLEGSTTRTSRRSLLSASALFFSSVFLLKHPSKAHAGSIVVSRVPSPATLELLGQASEAWGRGLDPTSPNRWAALAEACTLFDKLVATEPERLEWREARGQLRVDSKKFNEALTDFNFVLEKNPSNFRGYSSRALAYEGLAVWDKAVEDYTTALRLGKQATGFDEPYVLNSRGNAFASLQKWDEALRDYELSVKGFQAGRQLDGAIYSAANAALMQIQLGNEKEGLKELTTVARRAPGSIDMRAALAALYWSLGREREAESTWEFACENINAGQLYDGCAKYRDQDWLRRIRRWPPVMADRMQDFFQLRHKS